MSQKNDELQLHLNKLEVQRIRRRSLREMSAVVEVLQKSDCPLTIQEISDKTGRLHSDHFTAFVEVLVLCGYLVRQCITSETTYSIQRHNPGTMPKPLVPLPIGRYEAWIDKDYSN